MHDKSHYSTIKNTHSHSSTQQYTFDFDSRSLKTTFALYAFLYPPSEWNELASGEIYCDAFFLLSVRLSVCEHSVFRCKYLENGLR